MLDAGKKLKMLYKFLNSITSSSIVKQFTILLKIEINGVTESRKFESDENYV